MIKVQIAQLKNGLSAYLRKVREGVEILITDREEPVARLVPISGEKAQTTEEVLLKMQAEKIVDVNFSAKTREKRLSRIKLTPGVSASDLVLEDRDR